LKLYIYEIVFGSFAKSECRFQLDGHLRFCENQLKVSDVVGKMVLTP